MTAAAGAAHRFVRAVIERGAADRAGQAFEVARDGVPIRLASARVRDLQAAGVLGGDAERCTAIAASRSWLRRQLIAEDPQAGQHRDLRRESGGVIRNVLESPLGRLAVAGAGEQTPFLAPHQVAAGERVRRLVARAGLVPRLTTDYSAAGIAGRGSATGAPDIGDMAADARRRLSELHRVLPRDCADVVLDVCGLDKGLQVVEVERGWPRRSAKLVLRIGLDRLAEHFGLAAGALGPERGRQRTWMAGDRPPMFD